MNAIPLIAAGLADKLDVKVIIRGSGAYTDGKVINLPHFEIKNDKHKQSMLGYLSHEAAHIKYESFKDIDETQVANPLIQNLWNIFEDVRIENCLIAQYKGCAGWIDQTIKHIGMEARGKNIKEIFFDFILLHSRCTHRRQYFLAPEVKIAENKLAKETSVMFVGRLITEIDSKLGGLKSSLSALKLAEDVHKFLNSILDEEKTQANESDTSDQGESGKSKQDKSDQGAFEAIKEILETSAHDNPVQNVFDDFISQQEVNTCVREIPVSRLIRCETTDCHIEPGHELHASSKSSSNQLAARLRSLVQAEKTVRAKTSTSGLNLNNRVLYRGGIGDNRIFKTKKVIKKVDSIVEIVLDKSGSMRTRMTQATTALGAIAIALNGISGVNVTASCFPATNHCCDSIELLSENEKINNLFPRLASVDADGYTPSYNALIHSITKVMNSRKTNKVIFFITDGLPARTQRIEFENLLKQASNQISVVGIGIGIGSVTERMQTYFDEFICINDVSELKKKLFDVAKKHIIN